MKRLFVESIDALLLTHILDEAYGGHILGITDADLKTQGKDDRYDLQTYACALVRQGSRLKRFSMVC